MTDMLIRDIQQNDISLTFSQESFSDMILSFLGQKEKIEYITTDRFLLRHNDIEQFYYLIEQKLAKEKNIRISHFSLVTIYNDKTTRETNGIESVSKFNETRDVMPVSVTLSWNILVSFPNSQSIENQRIDLSFLINHVEYSPSGKYNLYFMPKGYYKSDIILSIQHTNQSWGVEILNLLRDKITQVTNKERFLCVVAKKVLLNFSTLSTILIYSFFIILACIFWLFPISWGDHYI